MRALWPREHGAYFQLAIPLISACASRSPTVAAIALALASCLAFVAHESLAVLLGNRGRRRREVDAGRARVWLSICGTLALVLGVGGLVAAAAWVVAAMVASCAAVVLVLGARRRQHTFAGEIVAVVALTGACAPVAVACGASLEGALVLWLAWATGFAASVVAVHRVLARKRKVASPVDRILVLGLAATAILAITDWRHFAPAVPLVTIAALVAARPPAASHLRGVGIVFAATSLVSAVLVVAG